MVVLHPIIERPCVGVEGRLSWVNGSGYGEKRANFFCLATFPFKVKPKKNYGSLFEFRDREVSFWSLSFSGLEKEILENGLPAGRFKSKRITLRGREFGFEDRSPKRPFLSLTQKSWVWKYVLTEKGRDVLSSTWVVKLPDKIEFSANNGKYQLVMNLFRPDLIYKNGVLIGELGTNRPGPLLAISSEEPPEVYVFLFFLFLQYWGPNIRLHH
jgi:hypothetical protein